jgi:hypothetical protein
MNEKLYTIHFSSRNEENKTLIIKTVTRPDGSTGGCTKTSLLMDTLLNEKCVHHYNCMMDAIESMILSHACAGINIEDEKYAEGVRVAYEACCNHAFA